MKVRQPVLSDQIIAMRIFMLSLKLSRQQIDDTEFLDEIESLLKRRLQV
jgi:hypothetical protein